MLPAAFEVCLGAVAGGIPLTDRRLKGEEGAAFSLLALASGGILTASGAHENRDWGRHVDSRP